MEPFKAKFKLIFIPFLYIALTSTALYTFLNWLCCIKTDWYAVDEETADIFIPAVALWIPLLLWLRPRLKLLDVKSVGRKDPLMIYLIVAWVTIGVPLIVAQKYMVKASGTLTQLDSMSHIEDRPLTKYYKVRHYFIDSRLAKVKTFIRITGKNRSNYDISVYAPLPVFDKDHTLDTLPPIFRGSKNTLRLIINGVYYPPSTYTNLNMKDVQGIGTLANFTIGTPQGDSSKNDIISVRMKPGADLSELKRPPNGNTLYIPPAWVSLEYHESISNHSSQLEKDQAERKLREAARKDITLQMNKRFIYLDRIGRNDDRAYNEDAISANSAIKGPLLIFDAVNEPFENRADNLLAWLIGTFTGGALLFLTSLAFKPLTKRNYDINAVQRQKKNWILVLQICEKLFLLNTPNLATLIILGINTVVFLIAKCLSPEHTSFSEWDLLHWGANYRAYVDTGQYWRLLTSIFLHTGLIHLLFNLYGLMVAGAFAEPLIGKVKFIAIYLLCGVIAGLTSIGWDPEVVRVGSSGAVFGIYGAFLVLLALSYTPKNWGRAFFVASSFYVFLNLLLTVTGVVDMVANLIGLLIGLICGVVMSPFIKKQEDNLTSAEKKRRDTDISSF